MNSKYIRAPFYASLFVVVATGLVVAATQSNGPTVPTIAAGGNDQPSIRLTLLDDVRAEASAAVGRRLLDPENGSSVVPVAAEVEFMHEGHLIARAKSLKVLPMDGRTPIEWDLSGIGPRTTVGSQQATSSTHRYKLTIEPLPGKSWSEVKESSDCMLTSHLLD